jgi:hypothetical protein
MGDMIRADTAALDKLARNLKAASPASYKAAKKGLRAAGVVVMEKAAKSADWGRISGQDPEDEGSRTMNSGHVSVSNGLLVRVWFGGAGAPQAAAIENDGKGFVRHPTYSPRPTAPEKVGWTDKHSKPAYLEPARAATEAAVATSVRDVVEQAIDDTVHRL